MKKKGFFIIIVAVVLSVLIVKILNHSDSQHERLLALLPLTGRLGVMGQHIKKGMELYQKQHPDFGYDIIFEDTAGSASQALSIYKQRVLSQKPSVVLTALNGVTTAILPVAKEDGVFVMTALLNAENILRGHSNVQRFTDRSSDLVSAVVKFAVDNNMSVLLFHPDDESGISIFNSFKRLSNGQIPIYELSYSLNSSDVRAEVTKAFESEAALIYVSGSGSAYVNSLKMLLSHSSDKTIVCDSTFYDPSVLSALGTLAIGVPFAGSIVSESNPTNPKTKSFVEDFYGAYKEKPVITAVYAYDMCAVLDMLLKSKIEVSQEAFLSLHEWNGVSGHIDFLPEGECSPTFVMLQLSSEGVVVRYEKAGGVK